MLRSERLWPTAVLFDDLVNVSHDTDGLIQGNNDFLVVNDVIGPYYSWCKMVSSHHPTTKISDGEKPEISARQSVFPVIPVELHAIPS